MENQNKPENIDKNRRKFLAVMLIGSGAFLVEKILGPLFSRLSNEPPPKTNLTDKPVADEGGFQVVEGKKGLAVYDSSGEEIFQIDKGA